MHEMGIALEIIEIAIASVPDGLKDSRIKKVNVQVGKLSAITPDSLKFCFDIASKTTSMSGAELSLELVPVVVKCQKCKAQFTIEEPLFKCRECGSGSLDIVSGKELDIRSIVIEEKE